MNSISIKKAVIINAFAKYSVVIMNILFAAILSRILSPNDYGIIAVVTIFTSFFGRFSDMGLGTTVIQRKDLDCESVNVIFTITVYIGAVLALLFTILGYPISIFYGNTEYKYICLLLSISILFNTINTVPNSVMLRDKKFILIGIRTVIVNIVGYIFAIILAIYGFKYYSLVFQSIISSILNFLWNNKTTRLRYVIKINFNTIKSIWSYSFFSLTFNLINYVETNLDNILISVIMGSTSLAFYDKAYKLTKFPIGNLSGVVAPVLHPILSDYQSDKDVIYNKYVKCQKLLSLIGVFIVPICYCVGYEIIILMYGKQWKNSVVAFQYLSCAMYPMLMMVTTGAVYASLGNTKLLFKAGLINAFVTSIFIVIGILFGSKESIAICVSIGNWINAIITFYILIGTALGKSILKFLKCFFKDIIGMIFITIIATCFFQFISINNFIIQFIIKCTIIGCLYIVFLLITKQYKLLIPKDYFKYTI